MKLFVTVKAGVRQEKIEVIDESHLKVWVKAPAQDGKANEAVLKVLAEHFSVPRSRLLLVRGPTNKNKVIELL